MLMRRYNVIWTNHTGKFFLWSLWKLGDGIGLGLAARGRHGQFTLRRHSSVPLFCKYLQYALYVPGQHNGHGLIDGHWLCVRLHARWQTSVSSFNPPQILLRQKLKPLRNWKATEIKSLSQGHLVVIHSSKTQIGNKVCVVLNVFFSQYDTLAPWVTVYGPDY